MAARSGMSSRELCYEILIVEMIEKFIHRTVIMENSILIFSSRNSVV